MSENGTFLVQLNPLSRTTELASLPWHIIDSLYYTVLVHTGRRALFWVEAVWRGQRRPSKGEWREIRVGRTQGRQSGLNTTSATSRLFEISRLFRPGILGNWFTKYLVLTFDGLRLQSLETPRFLDFSILQDFKVSRLRDQKNNQCHGTGGTG